MLGNWARAWVGVSVTLEQCLYGVRTLGKIVAMGNPIGNMNLSQKGYWELLQNHNEGHCELQSFQLP